MKKRTPGEPFTGIPAVDWNRMVDAADAYAEGRIGQRAASRAGLQTTAIVKIKNDTGGALRRFEIVELQDDILTNVRRGDHWFLADTPDETKQFAVCLVPIPSGAYGIAQVAGVCPALVNVGATTDLWARVNSGDDVLQGDRFWGDARILSTPPGTGERTLWVHITPSPQSWLGKTDSAINKAASGTVSVWSGTPGSESDTGFNISSVYNRFANVGSGKWVAVTRLHRKPYLTAAEC